MGRSKETFNKKEKEKKRLKQRQDKMAKMEERKANTQKGKSLDDMLAYIDEDGNITSTPPDPKKKKEVNAEDIEIGVPKYQREASDYIRTGKVSYFDFSKGYGFITDLSSGARVFVHVNNLQEALSENDKVSFEVENGPKGLSAVNVKKLVA